MRIQRIEIHGFKSFPDRTVFQLGSGIAGVVGPNGCGKSNLVDAVRWCIGEQSARTLRGQVMEDVIFNGSSTRPPVGASEVSITFQAGDTPFPGEWARFDELRITRRLTRGGASDYFMNQQRVRLRDIHDLLLDTGAGNPLYSIIEQGRIGEIVQATPLQRRSLIEEAAGISRYKARRAEAQDRLVIASDNLARSESVVSELRERLDALARQVEKAARFRRYRAIVQQATILVLLSRHAGLTADRRALVRREREVGGEVERLDRDLRRAEAEVAQRRDETEVQDRIVGELRDHLAELEARRRELESARIYQDRERLDLEGRAERLAHEVVDAGGRQARAEREGAASQAEIDEVLTRQNAREAALASALSDQIVRRKGLDVLRAEADQKRDAIQALKSAVLRAATRRESALKQLSEIGDALVRRRRDVEAARAEAERLSGIRMLTEAQQKAAALRMKSAVAVVEGARAVLNVAEEQEHRARETQAEAERVLTQAEREKAAIEGRLDSLRQLQVSHTGFAEGPRRVLAAGAGAFAVSEEVEVPEVLQPVLATALGEKVDAVGVACNDELLAATKAAGEGQVWLVRVPNDAPSEDPPSDLLSEIGGTSRGKSALRLLLGGIERATDLTEALDRSLEKGNRAPSFLTANGELVLPGGVVSAGQSQGAGAAVLGRRQALVTTEADLSEAKAKGERQRQVADDAARDVETAAAAVRDARNNVEGARQVHREVELEASGLAFRLKASVEAAERHERTLGDLGDDEAREARRREEVSKESSWCDEEILRIQGLLASAENEQVDALARIREAEAEDATSGRKVADLREEVAVLRERVRAGQQARDAAMRAVAEAALAANRARDDAAKVAARRVELGTQETETEEDIVRVSREQASNAEKLEIAKKAQKDLKDRLRDREIALDNVRRSRDEIAKELSAIQARHAENHAALDQLKLQAEELSGVNLPGMLDALDKNGQLVLPHGLPGDERLPAEIKGLPTVEDLVLVPTDLDDDELVAKWRTESEKSRKRMDALGDVNLAAMEEYGEVRERAEKLEVERADLETTVNEIRTAIGRINRTCRERFRNAFDAVDTNFQTLFVRLAGGGQARLSLTGDEDVLEAGVDILAQPPGKRLQSLTLLSGGEKALVAIALIFALFQVRPSPFCLLDEVDAPLDEANGARYNEMLREMSRITQFLLITHNRTTMEAADTLYGITMQDPGVSKLVTVQVQ
jgi:chromosome segregation protein